MVSGWVGCAGLVMVVVVMLLRCVLVYFVVFGFSCRLWLFCIALLDSMCLGLSQLRSGGVCVLVSVCRVLGRLIALFG